MRDNINEKIQSNRIALHRRTSPDHAIRPRRIHSHWLGWCPDWRHRRRGCLVFGGLRWQSDCEPARHQAPQVGCVGNVRIDRSLTAGVSRAALHFV